MAASNAITAQGTLIKMTAAAGTKAGPFTVTIGEVTSITSPSLSKEVNDVTHMESPNGWTEDLCGLKSGGEVSVEFNYVPNSETSHQALLVAFGESASRGFQITFTDTAVFAFDANVTSFDGTMAKGEPATGSATLKITGEPTLPTS